MAAKTYAIINNTTKDITNVVQSDVIPSFITSSGDVIVEVTTSHIIKPSVGGKYLASTDTFLNAPGWLMYYDDSTTGSVSMDVMYLSGSVNCTASFNSDLSLVEESDWEPTGLTISNYRWDADNEKSTFTLTTDENLNDGDTLKIGLLGGTITDVNGLEWKVPHVKNYLYAKEIGSGSWIIDMGGEGHF
mgnify:CR=1 FL=1|jgi:hypothetical protein